MPLENTLWVEAQAAITKGSVDEAIDKCLRYWDLAGGPSPQPAGDGALREFTTHLTVWRQIELFVAEIDRRPHNPRTWKLLAYAYMWGGLYIPALLRAAEQAWLVCEAHYDEDDTAAANAREKYELTRRVIAGDGDARTELAAAEKAFAAPFDEFPEEVPFPEPFMMMGIVDRRAYHIDAGSLAPELREDDAR